MHLCNFLVCGPKFTRFLLSNVRGAAGDQLLFGCSICWPVSEIFAMKVESCQKSSRNLDIFLPSQILWGGPSENCTHVITLALCHVAWKSFMRIFQLAPKLKEVHTLNFKRNFTFSRLQFFADSPVPVSMCDSKAWLISSACKKFEGTAPFKGRNIVSRKMYTWVSQYAPL